MYGAHEGRFAPARASDIPDPSWLETPVLTAYVTRSVSVGQCAAHTPDASGVLLLIGLHRSCNYDSAISSNVPGGEMLTRCCQGHRIGAAEGLE